MITDILLTPQLVLMAKVPVFFFSHVVAFTSAFTCALVLNFLMETNVGFHVTPKKRRKKTDKFSLIRFNLIA